MPAYGEIVVHNSYSALHISTLGNYYYLCNQKGSAKKNFGEYYIGHKYAIVCEV